MPFWPHLISLSPDLLILSPTFGKIHTQLKLSSLSYYIINYSFLNIHAWSLRPILMGWRGVWWFIPCCSAFMIECDIRGSLSSLYFENSINSIINHYCCQSCYFLKFAPYFIEPDTDFWWHDWTRVWFLLLIYILWFYIDTWSSWKHGCHHEL